MSSSPADLEPDLVDVTASIRHRRSDLAWFSGSLLVLAGVSLSIDGDTVSSLERLIFESVNDVPGGIYPVVWVLMQYGTFVVIPIAAAGALIARRPRLAVELAAAGVGTWLLAKVVKDAFPRGRPGAIFEEAQLRGIGAGGRGYPSGHAAVAAAISFILWAYLPRRWRWVPIALAGIVCFARVYVGAHLPLDVVGGAALGVAVGAIATFLGGVPSRRRHPEQGP